MTIDSSYVNAYDISGIQQNSLERIGSALAINKASDDPSGSAIGAALGVEKSSLSQAVENMNSGIAMSNIAQGGLSEQKELLENIKTETLKANNGTMSESDREIIGQQINKYIEQYDNIANSTTYNGTSLLKTDGSSSDDISIVDKESTIEMEKADTTSISDTLKSLMSDFSTNANSRATLLDTLDQSINQIASYQSDFGSASNAMESSARNSISTETQIATAQATVMDIDYSEEVSSFSKTNLLSQIGLIMQSQANAVQGRNISLLSH
ncbi:flagellin [Arcobacteraceae bacterium]|nr:flagellin [Arcobacteraceae bacterium]